MSKKEQKKFSRQKKVTEKRPLIFTSKNYLLMYLGIGLIVLGFILMTMENKVEGFLSLNISPFLIVGGFVELVFAILYSSVKKESAPQNDSGKSSENH